MTNPKKKSSTKLRRSTPTVNDYNKLETKVIIHEELKEFKKELYSDLDKRFEKIDERFEIVDKRLIGLDVKLWGIFAAVLIAAVVNLVFK